MDPQQKKQVSQALKDQKTIFQNLRYAPRFQIYKDLKFDSPNLNQMDLLFVKLILVLQNILIFHQLISNFQK